jgi:predicted dehydrogenase
MTLRAAVIGCGRIGSGFADSPGLAGDVFTHAEAYVRSDTTQLFAVCDRDASAAEKCGARWNAMSFTGIGELLDEVQPEIVSICTPDDTHFEIARMALEAPSVRAILCEKPLATTVDDGEALVRIGREQGKLIAVAYGRRYAGNFRAIQRFLSEGEIGRVTAAHGWYGKGVLHNGSHWFDLVRMLIGEVEWVEAADRLREGGSDPTLDVTLGTQTGAVATVRGTDSDAFTIFEMDLLTDDGRVSIRESGHEIELFHAGPSPRYAGYTELLPMPHDFGDMRNTMLHAVDDLATALRDGREPLCSAEDGLAALRIATAARKSAAAEGMRIGMHA